MKIETIYKHFLLSPVSHLPLVDEDGKFIGLISKEKVMMDMADLSLQGLEFEKVPEHFIDFSFNESLIYYFQNNRTIPVLNVFSEKVGSWEKPRFLAEISSLSKELPEEVEEKEPEEETKPEEKVIPDSRQTIYKYIEIILENFPDPLFSTDKEGKTTFFNENFEKKILSISFFKDSISMAERYFKELNRDMISHFLKERDADEKIGMQLPPIQAMVKNLGKIVRIITLKSEKKVIGFLYHFIEPQNQFIRSGNYTSIPSAEQAFAMKTPLEKILQEIECSYIYNTLKQNKMNISHTASQLGIPRSTLQNKIKQLEILEKYDIKMEEPIPRKRSNRREEDFEDFFEKNIDNDEYILDEEFNSLPYSFYDKEDGEPQVEDFLEKPSNSDEFQNPEPVRNINKTGNQKSQAGKGQSMGSKAKKNKKK
ncbi:MAG: transcriptional regulator [Leptospiraceae bacterium]|nr:transcriptional regulator [Leptospiraceae bacterium]